MKIVKAQFSPWDKVYSFASAIDCQIKDWLIVETEYGQELAKVISFEESQNSSESLEKALRLASDEEVKKINDKEKISQALEICNQLIDKHKLDMKLIDLRFSFQANRLNFAFISDKRVDFRQLVKDLGAQFNANIRLTQIGTRDEAKISGDCGSCGRQLCCKGFIKEFSSISSEMAECQQVVHRGSDRISGACGRLMCCLGYEYEGYKELAKKLPEIGEFIKINGRRGKVIGHHVLKQSIDVLISDGKNGDGQVVIEIDPKDNSINKSRKQ
jgi:cell fate regulator YaaT (PSP1 superfamily)